MVLIEFVFCKSRFRVQNRLGVNIATRLRGCEYHTLDQWRGQELEDGKVIHIRLHFLDISSSMICTTNNQVG